MDQKGASHKREITIDSNWITTIAMALGLVFIGWALISEIRNLVFDHVEKPVSLITLVLVPYLFLLAFSVRMKSWTIALGLVGTGVAARVSSNYLHASPGVQHVAATGASIVNQIALTMILVVIVQWFRSVVRWNQSSEPGPDS